MRDESDIPGMSTRIAMNAPYTRICQADISCPAADHHRPADPYPHRATAPDTPSDATGVPQRATESPTDPPGPPGWRVGPVGSWSNDVRGHVITFLSTMRMVRWAGTRPTPPACRIRSGVHAAFGVSKRISHSASVSIPLSRATSSPRSPPACPSRCVAAETAVRSGRYPPQCRRRRWRRVRSAT